MHIRCAALHESCQTDDHASTDLVPVPDFVAGVTNTPAIVRINGALLAATLLASPA